jgi:hypothetical protein
MRLVRRIAESATLGITFVPTQYSVIADFYWLSLLAMCVSNLGFVVRYSLAKQAVVTPSTLKLQCSAARGTAATHFSILSEFKFLHHK